MIHLRTIRLPVALGALAVSAAAAFPATASASPTALEPEALMHARAIRDEINARYRPLPGRKLVVTEATTTGVVDSLTLLLGTFEPLRIVPADNGVYFAICSARARCPYPARSGAWPAAALPPRRLALELALRTFIETSVSLVVVALPTTQPVWVVFERDELLAGIDAGASLARFTSHRLVADTELNELVEQLTRQRLFLPLPILPPPDDTIYAVRI